MRRIRRGPLLVLVAAAALAPPASAAKSRQVSTDPRGGGAPVLARDPITGRVLAGWLRRTTPREEPAAFDLVVRPLDGRGRPATGEVTVGSTRGSDAQYGGRPVLAADTRRHRFLVVWSGWAPGMATAPCPRPPPPPPGVPYPVPEPCERLDHEIFTRVVAGDGRLLSPARRLTATGPADDPDATTGAPTVAYDPHRRRFLIVAWARVSPRPDGGSLIAIHVGVDGRRIGRVRPLRPGRSIPSSATLAADPRGGYLLAFGWGGPSGPRPFAVHLDARGRPARRAFAIAPQGAGAAMAYDPRRRSALLVWGDFLDRPRARRVAASGRPVGPVIALRRYPALVAPAAFGDGSGWLLALTVARPGDGPEVAVQAAGPTGRPHGHARVLSYPDQAQALYPAVLPIAGRRFLLAWTGGDERNGPDHVFTREFRG